MATHDGPQLCGTNFSYLRFPLERALDDVAACGLEAFELWGVSPHLYVEDATAADLEHVRRAIAARGLTLACFTPEQVMYPINIASRDATVRERSVRYFLKCVDACTALESPLLFLTSGWGEIGEDDAEVWARSAESLGRIAARAQQAGVTGVLEALQPVESHTVTTCADVRRMLDELASLALRPALDTVAMAVAGETASDWTAAFGGDIGHVHLVDGAPDGHLAWGDGELPLAEIVATLAAAGYDGFLSFELISHRYWLDPTPPLRRSVDGARAALAALAG